MKQMDWVIATFAPVDIGTLQPDVVNEIGVTGAWQAVWIIEEGPYMDQWAMMCWDGAVWPAGRWVPLCDLKYVPPENWQREGDVLAPAEQ